jgi:hypothetical protein
MNSRSGTATGVAMRRSGLNGLPGLRLAELGRLVGNLDYAVVSKAIAQFQRRMQTDPKLREHMATIQAQLPK